MLRGKEEVVAKREARERQNVIPDDAQY